MKRPLAVMVLLAIANPVIRRAMADEFRQRSAEEVVIALDWAALIEALENEAFGILVIDHLFSDRPAAPLIRNIRTGALHEHPFPLVIALSHHQTERDLKDLIGSGPDAVVLTPVSIASLFAKIDRLAAGRKPFVVAHDYVGPDRRTGRRAGAREPRTIEAPNPLLPETFLSEVQIGAEALKTAKMECSFDQLAFALKSGDATNFESLIPAIDHLAQSTARPGLKAAAQHLAAALRSQTLEDIIRCSHMLLAAAEPPASLYLTSEPKI